MRVEVARLLDGFEARFGYAPDSNEVREHLEVIRPSNMPSGVSAFFGTVDEVSLPDAWNGYFLGPAEEVIRRFERRDPGRVALELEAHRIIAIGSDGSGSYYAVDLDADGAVIRVSEATVAHGVLRGVVRNVPPDLDAFLEALVANVAIAARGEEPSF
jgi:hypothetical protein